MTFHDTVGDTRGYMQKITKFIHAQRYKCHSHELHTAAAVS